MAFELAEQGKKEEAYVLLDSIVRICTNQVVLIKVPESKAEACLNLKQYDSVIYYSYLLYSLGNYEPTPFLLRAKAYSMLGCRDSSVYYAQYVLSVSNELFDRNSALYILTHNDDSKDREDVRKISADRSDVQKQIEIRQGKMSQAVQLLQQDLARKPDLTWLIAVIITLLIIGGIFYRRSRTRKKQMHAQIEQIMEQQSDSIIQSIKQHIDCNDLENTLHWKNYTAMKADADLYMGGIVSKLENRNLNETEIRFCLLTMLDLSLAKIADIIHYSYPSGIKTLKKRTSVKLGTTPQNLRDFLFHMTANV